MRTPPTSLPRLLLWALAPVLATGLWSLSARAEDGADAPCPAPAPPSATPPNAPALPQAPGAAGTDGTAAADAVAAARIHHYLRIAPRLIRGEQPEGEEDFAALAAAGVTSILSVDGSRPDVATAKKYGMRYVHIPFGYDGIPQETLLRLTKAYQVLALEPGAIFVHCHHGKHRGPAASGIGLCVLAGKTPEDAVADMKVAGTDPKYAGLYRTVLEFQLPAPEDLAAVSADLPSVAEVPGMAKAMVTVDGTWDRLRLVRQAKWAVPPDHPDVEPSHEATILAELFRELARREDVKQEPEAFRAHLAQSEAAAWDLAKALEKGRTDAKAASAAFDRAQASCTACHATYRDNVHRRGAFAPAK